jgi:hypothetical protein
MGIKFICPACGRPLNVKSELAGKRGRCPKCQAKIAIPLQDTPGSEATGAAQTEPESSFVPETKTAEAAPDPTPLASALATSAVGGKLVSAEEQTTVLPATQLAAAGALLDPISEAPALQWYAVPAGGTNQYGPAAGEEFRAWMQEGRVTADALVWRQDWPDWKRAGSIFPQLGSGTAPVAAMATPVAAPAAMPLPTAAAAMPMLPGGPPIAQPAFLMTGAGPGLFPTAAPAAPHTSDGFPNMAAEPALTRTSVRGRAYRPRSNTGPVVAIVVLLLAMIPLSFFVWKVVSEQLGSTPSSEAATSSNEPEE